MEALETELSGSLATAGLVAVRCFAILRAQVLWRTVTGPLWWVLALGLGLALSVGTAAAVPMPIALDTARGWLMAAAAELVLGTLIGIVVSLPGHALLGAAAAQASVLRTRPGPWVGLSAALVTAVALGAGLHHPLLHALTQTHILFPLGDPERWLELVQTEGLPWLLQALHAMLVLALALATPVLLTAAVVELGLGLAAAAVAPTAPVPGAVRTWAGVAAALIALGASWAAYPLAWGSAVVPP